MTPTPSQMPKLLPFLRGGATAACVALVAACGADSAVAPAPADPLLARGSGTTTVTAEETASVSPMLAAMNERLAARGSRMRIIKAELRYDGAQWDGASSTILFANDRVRGFGYEWVPGDPRRDGRVGVSYVVASTRRGVPKVRDVAGGPLRDATYAELDAVVEEGTQAWRDRSCSTAPIARVPLPATGDVDLVDDLLLGGDPTDNVFPADIVQAGWLPRQFFLDWAGPSGDNIIGVAFTLAFVDGQGELTDIDGDGNIDTGLSEIFYNARFEWSFAGVPGTTDAYSIIAHETGHALGLAHFGKVFVTRRDAADGIQLADVKYAPKALMNAVYVTGRDEIAGTDNSSFCQIWASAR